MFGIEFTPKVLTENAKGSFGEWAEKEGEVFLKECVDKGLHAEGFSLRGKDHLVKDNLWKLVSAEVEQPALLAAINLEAAEYWKLPGLLCEYSENLPSQPCMGKNVAALPRRGVTEAAIQRLTKSIGNTHLLQGRQAEPDALLSYFIEGIAQEMDTRYAKAYRNESPMKIGDLRETAGDWTVIGLDPVYPWPDADHQGHYLLFHDGMAGFKKLSRGDKKSVEAALTQLEGSLGTLDAEKKGSLVESIVFRTEPKQSEEPQQWKMA